MTRYFLASGLVAMVLSACVSQTTVETRPADQPGKTDAQTRAQINTERAAEYYRLGKFAVALEVVQMAISANPNYAPAYNMLGIIYMELHEDAKAEAAYQQALRLAPNDSETLNNYGWFVCQRQSPAKSLPYFEKALKNPVYPTPEFAIFNTGVCARLMGDEAKADSQLRTTLQLKPRFAPAMYELAELRAAQGRFREAETLLSDHAKLVATPKVEVLYLGARVSRALGDKTSEASYIQQMRRRFPDDPLTRQASERR